MHGGEKYNMIHEQEHPTHSIHKGHFTNLPIAFLLIYLTKH
jgi:hypothetical protein